MKRYVVIDTETSGMSPAYGHTLCEIAMITCEGGRVLDEYQQLIHPGRTMHPSVIAFHGITDAMVKNAPRFFEIKDEILKRMEGTVLLFHNAPFDLKFIGAALNGCGAELPDVPVLDTLAITRKLYPGISHSLPKLTERFDLKHETKHRALADAEATRRLFLKCAGEIEGNDWTLEKMLAYQGQEIRYKKDGRLDLPPDFLGAMTEQRPVRILYQRQGDTPFERSITPRSIQKTVDTIYIDAFCHLRHDTRRFRWDRILKYTIEK